MTMIIGCDFHPSFQQIAYVDAETEECGERRLSHRGEAERFYRSLVGKQVRIGVEATGGLRWFRSLLHGLGHELLLGDASAIRASCPRRQKTDKRDAQHILSLLMEDRFPAIWQPGEENEELLQLMLHRFRMVQMRARVKNQLVAIAKNEGVLGSRIWSPRHRKQIESLPLTGWHEQRRKDLLEMLDEFDRRITPLNKALAEAAEQSPEARLLMTQPGVGPVVSLAYVLVIGDWKRFPRGKQVGSYLGTSVFFLSGKHSRHQQRVSLLRRFSPGFCRTSR